MPPLRLWRLLCSASLAAVLVGGAAASLPAAYAATSTTVIVSATVVNTAPVAQDATVTIKSFSTATGTLTATDAENETLTFSLQTPATNGSAAVSAGGGWSYTPAPTFAGTDTFVYAVSDPRGGADTATVTITVVANTAVPVAADVAATVEQGGTATGTLSATDADGDTLTFLLALPPTYGTAVVAADGGWSYTPQAGFSGTDSFVYGVSDGRGGTTTARVTVTVTAVDPLYTDVDPLYTDEDGDGLIGIIELWLNCDPHNPDTDGDGVWDGEEVWLGTDATAVDSDEDGTGDGAWIIEVVQEKCGCTIDLTDDTNGNGVRDYIEYHFFGGLYDPALHGGGSYTLLIDYLWHRCGCGPEDLNGNGMWDTVEHYWGGGGRLLTIIHRCGCLPWQEDGDGGGWSILVHHLGGWGGLEDDDGDGLVNYLEILLGCDPHSDDTDGDGLSDYDEVYVYDTDPLNPDTDGDDLVDGLEIVYGCNPNLPDTDGDGLLDGLEVGIGSNATLVDTDGDGLTDGHEYGTLRTDPLRRDTDGDGLDDGTDPAPLAYVGECRISVSGPLAVGATVTGTVTLVGQVTGASLSWGDGTLVAVPGAGTYSFQYAYDEAGAFLVGCTVTDSTGGTQAGPQQQLVVYDPNGGFVTGGGWIHSPVGAMPGSQSSGPARFGFVSQYKKGATTPTGQSEFQFLAGGLNFHSASYDWLVVSGARAQYRGTGTIDGRPGYAFLVTLTDGDVLARNSPDRFRMKIWHEGSGAVVYDSQPGLPDTAEPVSALAKGSVTIHK